MRLIFFNHEFYLFTNQGYPLQNSSLGQLHSDGGVVSIVHNSAGRLLLVYLSTRRLSSSGCYLNNQTGALSSGFWPRGIKRSHRDWDPANRGAEEPQECFLGMGKVCSVPILTFAFCLGVVLQNPWFITCDNATEEFWLPLKAVQKIKTICSVVRFFGTILAHTFLMSKSFVKILWTVNGFKLNSLLIILNVNRRSDLTRDLTLSTLSSVF